MSQPLNFPARVYQILENENPEIVQWNSNGLSFRIVNHVRFELEIIPKYFRHRKLSSVQRQLNVYGFRSISRGEHKRSFYHPLFKRGNWEVVRQMQRYVPTKGGQDADFDPNSILDAPNAEAAAICGDFNAAVAGLFGSQPLVQTESAAPAAPVPARTLPPVKASASTISMSAIKAPVIPTFGRSASGGLQVCIDFDEADNHYSTDFHRFSEVGHEQTSVHVQPVDYSIPLNFRVAEQAAALPADAVGSIGTSSGERYEESQNAPCDWAVNAGGNEDELAWAGMLFEPEEEDLDFLWASASAPACVAAPQLLKSAPDDTPATTAAPVPFPAGMPALPPGVVRMQSGGNREQMWTDRFRSDSLDDVYALCAELC